MVYDVGLTEPRVVDDYLIEDGVIVETVDMNPVPVHASTEIGIHLPWIVGNDTIAA